MDCGVDARTVQAADFGSMKSFNDSCNQRVLNAFALRFHRTHATWKMVDVPNIDCQDN